MSILAIDLGTTNTKVYMYEENTGAVLSTGSASYPIIYDKPGQMEQNPLDWWKAVSLAIRDCLNSFTGNADEIKVIGFSGQMVGFVPMDNSGKPLFNCITHMDTRCRLEIEEMKVDSELLKAGYNVPSFITSAPKFLWFKRNYPDIWSNMKTWLHPKDFIRYCLTGKMCTEITDASDTLFLNFHKHTWDPVMEKYGFDVKKFPAVYKSTDIVGEITEEAAAATGLKKGTRVVAGAADMACAAIGTRALNEGSVSVTVGTVGHLIAPIKSPDERHIGRIFQFCHAVPELYYAFGAIPAGGFAFAWLREVFESCMNEETVDKDKLVKRMNDLAEKVKDGSEDLFFLPYLTGVQMPMFDPNAKGVFVGLKPGHKAGHMSKSVMEGVAFVFKQLIDSFTGQGIIVNEINLGDGGCKSDVWVHALKNIIGCKNTNLMMNKDSSPIGAAIIAGMGAGIYKDWNDASENLAKSVQLPYDQNTVENYKKRYNVFNGIYPALKNTFTDMYSLNE